MVLLVAALFCGAIWLFNSCSLVGFGPVSRFSGAHAFTGTGLSGWNVSEVIDMQYMFFDADNFNGELLAWDVSSVTTMRNMVSHRCAWRSKLANPVAVSNSC